MSLKDYRFDGEEKLELRGMNTGAKKDGVDKEDILRRTEKNLGRIEALQDKLYADGRESVLIARTRAGGPGLFQKTLPADPPF